MFPEPSCLFVVEKDDSAGREICSPICATDVNDKESSSVITKKGSGKSAENKRYGTLTLI